MPKNTKQKPLIHIGTSGWSYAHWKEIFFPEGLKTGEWLNFYAEAFPTVEINSTFYRTPSISTFHNWYDQVPDNFLFSLKINRYITHLKRLKDCRESLDYFYKNVEVLKPKVGPILFQLPPTFHKNSERFTEFLSWLHPDYRYVFEFRHESWFVEEVYELLAQKQIGLCITDLTGSLTPEVLTTDFTYLRLHGPKKAYQGSYGKEGLREWQKRIMNWSKEASVFCYFDNDEKGYAIQDARSLTDMFRSK
ncbi:MAG: DUF72 domain-containing protein [Parachlamydiales bacterium]|jgi:uncharacterized protein YecE (DUF72 family)